MQPQDPPPPPPPPLLPPPDRTQLDAASVGMPSSAAGLGSSPATLDAGTRERWAPVLAGGIGASLVGLVGSFLPWATVTVLFLRIDVEGTEGDGQLTAALAVVAVILALVARAKRSAGWCIGAAVASALAAAIAIYHLVDVGSLAEETGADVDRGIGLWMCGVAFPLAAAAFLLAAVRARRARAIRSR